MYPGGVAQWLEQSAHNRLVAGSIPATPTTSKCTSEATVVLQSSGKTPGSLTLLSPLPHKKGIFCGDPITFVEDKTTNDRLLYKMWFII